MYIEMIRHRFRGVLYRVMESEVAQARATCDDPQTPMRSIKISPKTLAQNNEETLETIIHEALHACFWDLSEEAVDEAAVDIAGLLWALGYRSPDVKKPLKKPRKRQGRRPNRPK